MNYYMDNAYIIPHLPLNLDLESKAILRKASLAGRALAELKGVAETIPNKGILISTLTMQEAKDSSEIENIVTTQDDLYKADIEIQRLATTAATKEVLKYREALQLGWDLVKEQQLLTNSTIKRIQMHLENNRAGFRTQAGTMLKDSLGRVVYMPPQHADEIERYMTNLEAFINSPELCDLDPLIKMAIMHHQFESIHPFYDGNGRTGRIINVLYLVLSGLLDLPILYLSRFITHHKAEYYRLIQAIRDKEGDNTPDWEAWILFILDGVEETARHTISLVRGISQLMQQYKQVLRPLLGKSYKHELLNNLFCHPYTKIEYLKRDMTMMVEDRRTVASYLDRIVKSGLLTKVKIGRENYYINDALVELFLNHSVESDITPSIETRAEG